jgi:hypothetical protein
MNRVLSVTLTFFAAATVNLSAQAISPVTGGQMWTPWEASASANFIRAKLPALPQALTILNTNLNAAGQVPLHTNSDINMMGIEVELQQNVRSWLGFQVDVSGGYSNRYIAVPASDASMLSGNTAFHVSPVLLTGVYGPIVTLRGNGRYEIWGRLQGGVARGDLAPDAGLKTAVRANDSTFAFASTVGAVVGGLGGNIAINRRISVRIGVDEIRTWLFGSQQNQLRGAAGILWRFGDGHDE